MPAANQAPLGDTRIRSTGLPHSAGGAGISTSSIRKSPLAASGTPVMFVLNWVKGGVVSQIGSKPPNEKEISHGRVLGQTR